VRKTKIIDAICNKAWLVKMIGGAVLVVIAVVGAFAK